MKISVIFLLIATSNALTVPTNEPFTEIRSNEGSLGLGSSKCFWPQGKTIKIKFLGHRLANKAERLTKITPGGVVPPYVEDWLRQGFDEWLQHTSLSYKIVSDGPAEVRVSLDCSDRNWATFPCEVDAKSQEEATMNLRSCSTSPGIVRHEIGHALGFSHTQDSPASIVQVKNRDTMGPDWAHPSETSTTLVTFPDDPDSIMYYPVQHEQKNEEDPEIRGFENDHISAGDHQMVTFIYPEKYRPMKASTSAAIRVNPGLVFQAINQVVKWCRYEK